jgi:copper(I)-binding protein
MSTLAGRIVAGLALALWCAVGIASDRPTISDAWARATAPGVDVGAAYVTITGGARDDELLSASTPLASMVHLHTVEETGGVARMRPVDGIAIPTGQRIVLAPKGMHIMLMGLSQPLVAGETFPLTLRFARSGEQTVEVTVRAASEEPPAPAAH